MIRVSLLAILPLVALCSFSFAADPEPKGLTATLVSNKDSYTLNPAQSGEGFRKLLKNLDKAPGGAPAAPKVDLTLQIKNPTETPIVISLGGDESQVTFTLTGEGAMTVTPNIAMTMEFRSGTAVTIEAGKTYSISLSSLSGGSRGISQMSYFTEAGDYKLSATLLANSGDKQMKITSEPITVKVVKK